MKVGDLVKRKTEWGDWVKHNPWMLTEKDLEIGMVIQDRHEWNETIVAVHWASGMSGWIKKQDLEKIIESR